MAALQRYAPFPITRDADEFGLRHHHVDSPFGRQHLVTDAEDGASTVTVFLHGVGGSWTAWTPVLSAARAAGHDLGPVCLLDLPGFGDSQNTTSALPADAVGAAIFDLAAARGWQRIHLVGHSMGGFLALDAAGRRPERLARLTVFAGTYISVLDTVQHRFASLRTHPSSALAYEGLRALAATRGAAPRILRALDRTGLLRRVLARGAAHPQLLPPSFVAELITGLRPDQFVLAAENGHGYDPVARWSRIDVPTTAVFGTADGLVPPADRGFVEQNLSVIRTTVVQDCGHFFPVERPFEVAEIIAVT